MDTIHLGKGDTLPDFRFRVTNTKGPVDLTGMAITLVAEVIGSPVSIVCTADPDQAANRGYATGSPTAALTKDRGRFNARALLVLNGRQLSSPNDSVVYVVVS